jgi:hypothetical protein
MELTCKQAVIQTSAARCCSWHARHSIFGGNLQGGASLAGLMISVGLIGIMVVGLSSILSKGLQQSGTLAHREEIALLRQTIEESLNCRETLGVLPSTNLPLNCSHFQNLPLKDLRGAILPSGSWQIRGSCRNNELVITAQRPGKNHFSGQDWSNTALNVDIFNGLGKFCTDYFKPSSCSEPQYPIKFGMSGNGPRCCRQQMATANTTPPYTATLNCRPGEYLLYGGHSCHGSDTGFTWPAGTPADTLGYFMLRRSVRSGNGWLVDCRSNDFSYPIYAQVRIVCCPY